MLIRIIFPFLPCTGTGQEGQGSHSVAEISPFGLFQPNKFLSLKKIILENKTIKKPVIHEMEQVHGTGLQPKGSS